MTRRIARKRSTRPVQRALAIAVVVGLTTAMSLVLPAAADDEITISPNQVVRAEPGSLVTVAEQAVSAELVGRTCQLRIESDNGSSVHPGNAVVATTGESRVEIPGVEDGSEASVIDVHEVTLGDNLRIQLLMGPEGLSSLGFVIAVDCPELPEAPVVTTPPVAQQTGETTTTTTATPTTAPLTSLPESPPAAAQIGDPTFTG